VWLGVCVCVGEGLGVCVCVFVCVCMGASMCLPSVAPPVPPHSSTLSHKRHDFREKVIEHKMCILIFSTFILNTSHSKKNTARYCHKCRDTFT
jgi:hypothetical protein